MKVARVVNDSACYRWSTRKLLDSCNWLSFSQLITYESVKYMHKIVYEDQPPAITSLLQYNMAHIHVSCYIRRPEVIYKPVTEKVRNSFLYIAVY